MLWATGMRVQFLPKVHEVLLGMCDELLCELAAHAGRHCWCMCKQDCRAAPGLSSHRQPRPSPWWWAMAGQAWHWLQQAS